MGSAIYELAKGKCSVIGMDKELVEDRAFTCEIMHVCIPYTDDFIGHVLHYALGQRPEIIIVHSTVKPGTCDELQQCLKDDVIEVAVAHSPIRGVHPRLKSGIVHYTKFFGMAAGAFARSKATNRVWEHLETDLGCREVKEFKNARTSEVAKLASTTLYAANIAAHQCFNRLCDRYDVSFNEAITKFNSTYFMGRELKVPRADFFPGKILGHCLMPNIDMLIQECDDPILRAIVESNDMTEDLK